MFDVGQHPTPMCKRPPSGRGVTYILIYPSLPTVQFVLTSGNKTRVIVEGCSKHHAATSTKLTKKELSILVKNGQPVTELVVIFPYFLNEIKGSNMFPHSKF